MYNIIMKFLKKFFESKTLTLSIKLLRPEAKIPIRGRQDDAAFDVYSCEDKLLYPLEPVVTTCGIACDIPTGYKIMIHGRSGLASKGIFAHIGTVDPNYKGEISPILVNVSRMPYQIKKGDRIGQISLQKIIPIKFIEVKELNESNRGAAGFGSSGR